MKFIILSVPFLFFSLISGASDAQTQIKNVHDAVSASTPTGTRGIASDEEQSVSTESSSSGYDRNQYHNTNGMLISGGVSLHSNTNPPPSPQQPAARTKKKSTPAAPPPSEGVGTGE